MYKEQVYQVKLLPNVKVDVITKYDVLNGTKCEGFAKLEETRMQNVYNLGFYFNRELPYSDFHYTPKVVCGIDGLELFIIDINPIV